MQWNDPESIRSNCCATALISGLLLHGCGPEPEAAPSAVPIKKASGSTQVARPNDPPGESEAPESSRLNPTRQQPIPELASTNPVTETTNAAQSETRYRHVYPQRSLDQDGLQRAELQLIESEHLRLVTDLAAEHRQVLVPLVEAMWPALEEYFGRMPPAPDGAPFRMTGYVMDERERFRVAGLLPEAVPASFHGRQIGGEFWMNNQTLDYYRAHLLLHEVVHAFMRHLPGEADNLPQWYLEGMAETLATHARAADGTVQFNVMPDEKSDFRGWERIALLQRDVEQRGIRSLGDATSMTAEDYQEVESYAWSWALCRFLDSHPHYRERFRRLARNLTTLQFRETLNGLYEPDGAELEAEWFLFIRSIEYGFDFERAAVEFINGEPLRGERSVVVASDRGWQSARTWVEAGETYSVDAVGRFTLADRPKPWTSEANGISIRYVRGRPIGRLLGCLRAKGSREDSARSMTLDFELGNSAVFTPQSSGTLYLRINDAWSELADNQGDLKVTIRQTDK